MDSLKGQSAPNPRIERPFVATPSKYADRYILVQYPKIREFMSNPRFEECICCMPVEGHPCPANAYMVPEDLYFKVNNGKNS